ncbi:hypothetical protein HBH70_191220 [Parastagonospora nodorum]|nr:hypothetical protein HBH53_109160 [Parastagonospora nodorum]KAH3962056.1 hypothetical protein HBH51_177760 [Parastagonospora nodorum]KAH4047998.1 hypothetical protein HBH49_163120 [Parastagonospora nodorum]KAH4065292.1 hypothetical protein HBH50_164420 [Parastagonospora nodorum]KAH4084690.1 hypothetical protein HBH48_162150 [Parastagonospora nodorum]
MSFATSTAIAWLTLALKLQTKLDTDDHPDSYNTLEEKEDGNMKPRVSLEICISLLARLGNSTDRECDV